MKPEGVTTQMKALDGYILMVVLALLLNRVHVNFMFNLDRQTWQWKGYFNSKSQLYKHQLQTTVNKQFQVDTSLNSWPYVSSTMYMFSKTSFTYFSGLRSL